MRGTGTLPAAPDIVGCGADSVVREHGALDVLLRLVAARHAGFMRVTYPDAAPLL
jgi:hypothetical protein